MIFAQRPARTALLASMAVAALLPLEAGGQAPDRPPLFADVVEVRVVNIEAVVTDRAGNRVSGLDASDFVLEVDGEEVPIDYFSEIREGRTRPRATGAVAEVPSLGTEAPVPTNYLVFVDDYFSITRDRDRVLDAMETQLASLRPEDRVAVVAFDGKKLDMLTTWTASERELERAFRQARSRPTFGLQRLSEQRMNDLERRQRTDLQSLQIERIQAAGGSPPTPEVLRVNLAPTERAYAERLATDVKRSVMAAVSTLRSFAGPEGRKVMLLLSGGWPFSPAEYVVGDLFADAEDVFELGAFDSSIPGREDLFRPLSDTANLLSYTLYPVDVPGLFRDTVSDASLGFTDLTAGGVAGSDTPSTVPPRELQVHAGLDFLADRTGGRALINARRDEALAAVIEDTGSYYWLGFQPQRNEDDRRHDIVVRVRDRPDLRVRNREGYVDLSRSAEITMQVESALLIGDPPTTQPLVTNFGRPHKRRGRLYVPLEVGVPLDYVTLVPQAGRWVNDLEIRITVMDERGNRSETSVDRIPIDGAQPPKPGQLMFYETELALRDRSHRIVIAVFDPVSGAILSSSGEIGR